MNRATPWLIALAIAVALASSHHLDIADHSEETDTALALEDAQRAEAAALRRDLAAAKLCRQQHGEGSFTWNAAGQLVCVPRKGYAVATVTRLEVKP